MYGDVFVYQRRLPNSQHVKGLLVYWIPELTTFSRNWQFFDQMKRMISHFNGMFHFQLIFLSLPYNIEVTQMNSKPTPSARTMFFVFNSNRKKTANSMVYVYVHRTIAFFRHINLICKKCVLSHFFDAIIIGRLRKTILFIISFRLLCSSALSPFRVGFGAAALPLRLGTLTFIRILSHQIVRPKHIALVQKKIIIKSFQYFIVV